MFRDIAEGEGADALPPPPSPARPHTHPHPPTHTHTLAPQLKLAGAKICKNLEEVTHVLVSTEDLARLEEIQAANVAREVHFHVVPEQWVCVCVFRQMLCP